MARNLEPGPILATAPQSSWLWFPVIAAMAGAAMAVLMLGAVGMHVRIADPLRRALPALSMMLLSLAVVALNWKPAFESRRRLSLGKAGCGVAVERPGGPRRRRHESRVGPARKARAFARDLHGT